MRLQDEIKIPVSAKTTMADEDKKFGTKKQSLEVCDSLGFQFVAKLARICYSCSHPLALGTRRSFKKSHDVAQAKNRSRSRGFIPMGDFRGLFQQISGYGSYFNNGGVAPSGYALHSPIMNCYLLLSRCVCSRIPIAKPLTE